MSQQTTLRVLSYNIHKGFGQLNRKYIAEEIRHSIRLINADVLFLQEVVGRNDKHHAHHHDWEDNSQLEFLADSVWHHYAYGKNAIYDHGHHGNAILSKYPFIGWENIDISFVKTSYRGILCGKLSNQVQLMCTHFGLMPQEQRKQTRMLKQQIDKKIEAHQSFILAGDFNDYSQTIHKNLIKSTQLKECFQEKNQRVARTFPSKLPVFPLDRIYYSGMELVDCEVLSGDPWNKLSDHCALFAEFKL